MDIGHPKTDKRFKQEFTELTIPIKETTMDKSTIQYNLTQEEATIIEDIRAMVARQSNESREGPYAAWVRSSQLTQKYHGMSVEEFMEHYTNCMGDDIVEDFLSENLSVEDKLDAIVKCIKKNDLVDHLFDMYVTKEVKNSIFYNCNDTATLTVQMVDMIMDGDWTPDN
jgi:hypothetical protein